MNKFLYAFTLLLLLSSCSGRAIKRAFSGDFDASKVPQAPDYSRDANWAALPWVEDNADVVAKGCSVPDQQASAAVDVFFIYPTIYSGNPKDKFPWNASVSDTKLNEKIAKSTIRQQASIFNAAGKVYSPRYRQAHLATYYTKNEVAAAAAFDTAYADVKRAFEYYLANHNNGRPIIIAGHSQGTTHGKRLVREFFDGKPLADQLVAAYLIGIGVPQDYFSTIKDCTDSSQTGCFVTWRTWQRSAAPWTKGNISFGESGNPPYAYVVNPLTWSTSDEYAPASLNRGGTALNFKIKEARCDAQNHKGILWINEPKFFLKFLVNIENWHVADLNLFYENVRENAVVRAGAFAQF
jgi:hypothetical protein